jgi:spore coat protein SA
MLDVWVIAPEDLPIPPLRGGSVQIYTYALIKHLANYENLSITLVSPVAAQNQAKKYSPTSSYNHILVSNQHGHYWKRVLHLIKKNKPDIVQIENRPKFVHAVRFASPATKIILNMHSTTFVHPKHISAKDTIRAFTLADRVVCNSQYLRYRFQTMFDLKTHKTNQIVIYPGVDLQKFKPSADRKLHTPIRLLYVGRVIRQKGLHVILRSLPILAQKRFDVHLTIIGRTPPWEAGYAKFVHRLSQHQPVKWKGFVDPKILAKYYQRADMFLCPSQRDEAFGLVNIEAMATGLPVIVSKVGGMTESVTTRTGLIVEDYQSPAAFAEAIELLVKNVDLWRIKTIEARNRARQFSWENTAEQFHRVYHTI